MLKIVGKMKIKEGVLDEFLEIMKELVTKSAAEDGNVFYSINKSTEDDRVYAFIECWKDEEALRVHQATAHSVELFPRLKPLLEEPLVGEYYNEVEL